ncbi:hypothetical protein A9Q96_11045 [Rhodobacterales bacterium 52_120_T64]|nr:hypothetical protein A9Q96_11045 [Rhodobacterales bacterium 52_120_T64]
MPVRMTEVTPVPPSGIAKIGVEVGDVIAETNFSAELDFATGDLVEKPVESRDFAHIKQILQKMPSLCRQVAEQMEEPLGTDVAAPAGNFELANAAPKARQQLGVSESTEHTQTEQTDAIDTEPQNAEVIPLAPVAIGQISDHTSTSPVFERPPTREVSFPKQRQSNSRNSELPIGQPSEETQNIRHAPAQPKTDTQQTVAPPGFHVADEQPAESKLPLSDDARRDFGGSLVGISDKQQLQRPLRSSLPIVQPADARSQTAETKIVSQISTAISNTSSDTIEIRLDPPELGRVVISITQTDSGLSATVTSEKAEISELLRRHAELLSRELSRSGFSEASLEFSHRDQQQNQSRFAGDTARFSTDSPEQTELTSAIEIALQSHSGSLDIRL